MDTETKVNYGDIGDGIYKQFEVGRTYYFFDRIYEEVYHAAWSAGQVTPDRIHVMLCGSKIPMKWLYSTKNAAIEDGIDIYQQKIAALKKKIMHLDMERTI
jgi:hypothetical protein